MGTFDKLNQQFDLKNLDAAKLTRSLTDHQNSLIKIVLIVGSLFLVGTIFNNHRNGESSLRAKISQAQQKLDAIKDRDSAANDLNNFKSSIPQKLDEFGLITTISNYARSYNVVISSLSPEGEKNLGLYDVVQVVFNADADNFKDMMLFLGQIEGSKFSLRVDSWQGHEESNRRIVFTIEISSVIVHT